MSPATLVVSGSLLSLFGFPSSSCLAPMHPAHPRARNVGRLRPREAQGRCRVGPPSGRSPRPANLMGFQHFFRCRVFDPNASDRVTLARHTDSSALSFVHDLRPTPFGLFAPLVDHRLGT